MQWPESTRFQGTDKKKIFIIIRKREIDYLNTEHVSVMEDVGSPSVDDYPTYSRA